MAALKGFQGTVWFQREFSVAAKSRGCHLITDELLAKIPEIEYIKVGLLNLHSKKYVIFLKMF